jgi:hypothetical protein
MKSTRITSLLLLSTFTVPVAWGQDYARPNSTLSAGSWTAVGAASLHEALDEQAAADGDHATTTADTTMELGLSAVADPLVDTGHILRFRIRGTGNGQPEFCEAQLFEGGSLVATTGTQSSRGGYTTYPYTLTAGEASSITDYSNLRVRVISSGLARNEVMDVSWVELEVPSPLLSPPTLTDPSLSSVDINQAVLGATISGDGNVAITDRGTVWNTTGDPVTENALPEGGTAIEPYSHLREGLPAGTLVYFRGYATNSEGTAYSPSLSFYTEPTQATGASVTNIGANGLTLEWTPGGGAGSVVVIRQDNAVNASPVDGVEYTGDTEFGLGPDLGGGNYVVYSGTGTSVTVIGLQGGTTYHLAVFEYAGSGSGVSGINYQQDNPSPANATTLVSVPAVSSPTVDSVTASDAVLGATVDSDGGAVITVRGTVWNTTGDPVTENALPEGGIGIGSPYFHTRGVFSASTQIFFRGYATNSAGTGYSATASFYTEPDAQSGAPVFSGVTFNEIGVSWTGGSGAGSVLVVKVGSAVDADPVDGIEYTGNPQFGLGPDLGGGNYVVYSGTQTSVTVTGLSGSMTYHFAVYEYSGTGSGVGGINYLTVNPGVGSQSTTAAPGHNARNNLDCLDCHGAHGGDFVPRDTVQESVCTGCHNPLGQAAELSNVALHKVNGGTLTVDCGSCHDVHNNSNPLTSFNAHTGLTQQNQKLFRSNTTKYVAGALEPAVFHSNPEDLAFKGSGNSPFNGACQTCHTSTSYHTNDGLTDYDHNVDEPLKACNECHTHEAGFKPVAGGTCITCHEVNAGTRRAVIGEFSLASHHADSPTLADCEVCHDQSEHQNGNVRLWNADDPGNTAASIVLAGDPLTDSAEAAKLADFCISCHDADGANGNTAPFNDAVTIPPIDTIGWTSSSHATAATCFGDGTFGCHSSGHGSEKRKMLADYTVAPTSPGFTEEEEGFCYNCHSTSGIAQSDVETPFSSTTNWVINAAGENSNLNLNDRHDVHFSDQLTSGAKIECIDCHNVHTATSANPLVADPDPTDGRVPGTGAVLATGDFMTEWCLDCHDGDFPADVTAPTTALDNIRASYLINTHGEASGGVSTLEAGYGYALDTTVQCMDCHTFHVSAKQNLYHLKDIVKTADGLSDVPDDNGTFTYAMNNNDIVNTQTSGYDYCNTCHVSSMGNKKDNCASCHFHGPSGKW